MARRYRTARRTTPARVRHFAGLAADACGVEADDVIGHSRAPANVAARWLAWAMLDAEGASAYSIARAWGCDHTSILHAKSKGWGPQAARLREEPGLEVVSP
jgi:hypothetical protein